MVYVIARSLINFDFTADAAGDKAISRYVHEVKIPGKLLSIEQIAAAREIYYKLKFILALRNDVWTIAVFQYLLWFLCQAPIGY
jgi:hypothetical protein